MVKISIRETGKRGSKLSNPREIFFNCSLPITTQLWWLIMNLYLSASTKLSDYVLHLIFQQLIAYLENL